MAQKDTSCPNSDGFSDIWDPCVSISHQHMSQFLKFYLQTPVGELKLALEARPQIVLANVDTIANRVVQVAETDNNVHSFSSNYAASFLYWSYFHELIS